MDDANDPAEPYFGDDEVLDFSDLNLEAVRTDWRLPAGTHRVVVSEARIEQRADGCWVCFEYEAVGGELAGSTVSERFRANPDDHERVKRYLKRRLLDLGLSERRVSRLKLADLNDREYEIMIDTTKKPYPVIARMQLVTDTAY